MEGVQSFPIDEETLNDLVSQAKDFAISHGVVYRSKESPLSPDLAIHAPFQLFPSPIPRHCYQLACDVQQDYNLLMHRVAHDHDFLKQCLQSAIQVDDFTRQLWEIYETVQKEGITQPISLAMNRSDYMFNCLDETNVSPKSLQLKQIEFNTMASSFGGLSQQVSQLHRYMLRIAGLSEKAKNLPDNDCVEELAEAMHVAWKQYGNEKAVIVMLVMEEERNIYDQRLVEQVLNMKDPNIKVLRRSLKDFEDRGQLSEDKKLLIDGYEVSIVYFRMCYVPAHFPTEKSWATRLLIERSAAIKCPNIQYHLSGTKKVQQVLAQPGVVEKYIPDAQAANRIRQTFAGQYSLDMGADGDKALEMAMKNPEKFVLKPQREGGGNNTFGADIPSVLEGIKDSTERTAYVLMERIHPASVTNYPIRCGEAPVLATMVSEIGIFGTLVGTPDQIYRNSHGGHILRTKTLGTDEGGVASGFSALDSPYLV